VAAMQTLKHSVFLMLVAGFPAGSMAAEPSAISLAIGEQRSFPVEEGTRFSVGNPEVIQVKATQLANSGTILLVKGKAQGYSDLALLGDQGLKKTIAFRVVSKKQAAFVGDGKRLFSDSPGLTVTPSGEGWVAKGQAKSLDDWNSVSALQAQGKGRFYSYTNLHPLERLKAESRILRLFRSAGLSHLGVRGAGNSLVLVGNCRSKEEMSLAVDLAAQVVAGVRSHLKLPFEQGGRLRFRAKIMEVVRADAQALGLKWEEGVPGAILLGKSFSKMNFSLQAALKIMEKRGQARVLSQPQLLLNEKGIAELKVGGEIPIQLTSRESASVHWKPYGLLLRLELPGMSGTTARAKITAEISSLDPGNGSEGIPGLRVSRMETLVDMEIGKPVLLSGLMERRQSRNHSLLPLLGDIPILGELFGSKDFQENRSELMILLEAQDARL
jgi:Flp pilus assembly secretin CpaC